MSYVDRALHTTETVQFKAKFFWIERWTVYYYYLLGIVLTLWFVGFLILIYAAYRHLLIICTERAVTDRRIIQKHGIISVSTEEMALSSVETVTIHQSIFERIFGGGTVSITGRGGGRINLYSVDDPLIIKKIIESSGALP